MSDPVFGYPPILHFYDPKPCSLVRIHIHCEDPENSIAFDTRLRPARTASIETLVQYLEEQLGDMRRRYRIDERSLKVVWKGDAATFNILDVLDDVWLCGARATLIATAVYDPYGAAAYGKMQSRNELPYTRLDGTHLLTAEIQRDTRDRFGPHRHPSRIDGTLNGSARISIPPDHQRRLEPAGTIERQDAGIDGEVIGGEEVGGQDEGADEDGMFQLYLADASHRSKSI